MSTRAKWVSLIFFISSLWGALFGTGLSIILRWELGTGGSLLNNATLYNRVLTLHGIVIIFFMVIPALIGGFGNLLLPILLSCPDMLLPRVNNGTLVVMFSSVILLIIRIFIGTSLGLSWVIYPPLSTIGTPEVRVDCLIFSLHVRGISSLMGRVNYSVTALKGVSNSVRVEHIRIFVWCLGVTVFLLLLRLPVLAGALTI